MSRQSGWVILARFGARWEADLLVEALRAAKIPVLVDGGDTSLFGPGFGGGLASAVVVRVPIEFAGYADDIRSVFDTGPAGLTDTLAEDPDPTEETP